MDVSPAALHQVSGQTPPNVLLMPAAEILRQVKEILIEEAEQGPEGLLVPRVRRGCYKNEMARFFRCGEARDELVPLMPAAAPFAAVRASMRFVDNNEFGTSAKKSPRP